MTEKMPAGVAAVLKLGEEHMTTLLTQLLSHEGFVRALQSALGGAAAAKSALDKGLIRAFTAVNVPTVEDVQLLQQKIAELEESLADVARSTEVLEKKLAGRAEPTRKKTRR
jgi:hypothetical protein